MARDTGFPRADVENDFLRMRRRQVLAKLAHKLSREPDDVNLILPFDEVITALGFEGERFSGLKTIKLGDIVGTVDTRRDFDRRFRPTSARVRERWERLALAQRRGVAMPPIDVYKVGDMYFVKDGHHRVSIALAQGLTTIDAYVTDVKTTLPAKDIHTRRDLLFKSYERMFLARVPLPPSQRARITVTEPWSYAKLGENVEAWGFRYSQHAQRFCDRAEIAKRWFAEEYSPVVKMLRDADLLGEGTEAEAYMRVAAERYRLILTHEWSDEIIARLREPAPTRRRRHSSQTAPD
jgi:ParB-like chromosome segregation protein Spo0J